MLAPVTGGCAPAKRRLRHRVLHGRRPAPIRRPRRALADLRRLLRRDHGASYPNRIYQHAAQTERLDQSLAISSLPTIWDRLAAHRLQGRYYYTDVPTLALWGTKYRAIAHHLPRFLADCRDGTLPHVAFVDPEVPRGGAGDLVGRPPPCRHPQRPGLREPDL